MSPPPGRGRLAAVLLSGLVCPGAGQIFKGDYVKGAVLIGVSLAVLAAIVVKTWIAMFELTLSVPPEELLSGMFGIAHRIMDENTGFFGWSGLALAALWVAGVADAALTGYGKRPKGDGVV